MPTQDTLSESEQAGGPAWTPARLQRLAVGVLVFWALLGADRVFQRGREVAGIDFYQFWVVGLAARQIPGLDPYSEAARRAIPAWVSTRLEPTSRLALAQGRRPILETYSSPFLYAVFGFFATGRYDFDHGLFEAASLAALAFALALIGRRASLSWTIVLAVMVFVFEWTEPVFSEASVGNVGRLQLALLALVLCMADAPRDDRWTLGAGVLLGLGLAFKPTLLPVVVLLTASRLLRRRWRALLMGSLGLGLGVLGAVLFSLVFFPFSAWSAWLRAVAALPPEIVTLQLGNYSLLGLWGTGAGSGVAMGVAAALVAATAVVAARRQPAHPEEERLVMALGCLVGLLGSPLAWTHYFVLALPMAILCLFRRSRAVSALALCGLATQATRPLLSLSSAEGPLQEAVLLNLGVLLLFLAGLLELRTAATYNGNTEDQEERRERQERVLPEPDPAGRGGDSPSEPAAVRSL